MLKKLVSILCLAPALFLVLQGLEAGSTQDSGDKVVLKLELPKPMFIGTPKNIRTANLEKVTGKKRGDFYVPKGTALLSADKPVTSSDMEPVIGEIEFVTDGEKSGEDGYYVELGPGVQYVQIDLEERYSLHAILVWHYHTQARVYRDVIIQIADDPDFTANVQTLFNNDHDNSSGLGIGRDKEYIEVNEGRLFDPRGAEGRYVRLYSNGNTANDMNHYVEVEVYGTAAQ
jgi:hypothetical protein